jgi:asparagine synthase (glutamine-hydrolysing)
MLERQSHRGPDGSGVFSLAGTGTLGHRRLAIIDPRGGKQPISNEDRSARVIANGEIYNFRRLRGGLESQHHFATDSDSEVAVHLFEDLGPIMARKIDGMFALAILQAEDLFLVRDPLGVKPLYYAKGESEGTAPGIIFASEIKALKNLGLVVSEFPPGTCYDSTRGFIPYYRVPERQPRAREPEILRRILRETLEASVVKRLMSDVPLGVFLSGGLDSSVIAAIASRHVRPLHTFAVGTEGSSDLEAARIVSRHIGSTHHEYTLTPAQIETDLDRILYHLESFDQDLVRSAIPCFYCSLLASEHVKVVLTGEGADELFAGYAYYREIADPDALHRELRRSVSSMHNVNLQRVDRMTMAHGVEGRVPFLDLDLVHLASTVSPELKLNRGLAGKITDKWILRASVEDLLPREIVWRGKEQLDEGSGTLSLLDDVLARRSVPAAAAKRCGQAPVRSGEERVYYRSVVESFGDDAPNVFNNMGRWREGRLEGRHQ